MVPSPSFLAAGHHEPNKSARKNSPRCNEWKHLLEDGKKEKWGQKILPFTSVKQLWKPDITKSSWRKLEKECCFSKSFSFSGHVDECIDVSQSGNLKPKQVGLQGSFDLHTIGKETGQDTANTLTSDSTAGLYPQPVTPLSIAPKAPLVSKSWWAATALLVVWLANLEAKIQIFKRRCFGPAEEEPRRFLLTSKIDLSIQM